MTSPSIAENGAGYFLTGRDMAWFYQQYLPAGLAGAAEADLAHAEVTGVAPAIVVTAEFDPLRDEGSAYADRLTNAGVVDAADATVAAILARLAELLG